MMVKSGLGKVFLKFLHAGNYFSLHHVDVCLKLQIQYKKEHIPPAWRDIKNIFSRPLLGQKL